MALSYYSTTRPGALSVAMNSSTTSVPLVSATTFPDPAGPGNSEYSIIVGYGSDREEVCTVTAKAGDTLTVIRGQDSTAATGKNQGDVVVHGVSARDFKSFAPLTDPRFTDARTPTVHAPSHATGGSDVVTPAAIGAATPASVTAAINAAIPIGVILLWSGTVASIPANWHLCDGLAGTVNLKDKFVVGAGAAYTANVSTGGVVGNSLTIAQMPSHAHPGSTAAAADTSHAHFYGQVRQMAQSGGTVPWHQIIEEGAALSSAAATLIDYASHTHTITVAAQGSGANVENRPPYWALAYIQKIA